MATDPQARHALFAYGSLQVEEVMEAVTGRRFAARPARLPGHRRRQLHGCSYPGVRADIAESTDGVLFEGLDADVIGILDLFEGEPYERRRVTVGSVGASGRPARLHEGVFVYVIRDEHAQLMSDRPWRLEGFRSEALDRFLAECRAFREALAGGADWSRPA